MNTPKASNRLRLSRTALLLAASAMPFAASAQETNEQEGEQATEDEQQIVVVGSRIARDPNIGSPSPILAIEAEDLTQSGTSDVVDILRDVPALSTSTTAEGSIDGVFSANVSVGQSILNLRGLGENRTLVLVNGRRHVSGIAGQQAVDINSIPTALIERVETLTGGASSLYGADAVTGVVNFVLRDDFDGIQANVQSGISSEGDAWRINGDLTWGTNFADGRGNITISGAYAYNEELQFGDRDFSRNNGIFDDQANPALRFQVGDLGGPDTPNFNGSAPGSLIPTSNLGFTPTAAEQALIDRAANATTRFIAGDPRFSLSSAGGIVAPGDIGLSDGPDINNNGIADCLESAVGFNSTFNPGAFGLAGGCAVINPDGSLSVYQDGLVTGIFNQFGGDGIQNNFDVNSLIPETERWSVNANLTYEISSEATFFFEGKYVSNSAEFQAQPNTFYDLLTIRADNPFITGDLQDFVAPLFFGNGTDEGLYLTRDPADLGPNRNRNEFETLRFVAGLRGDITDHFAYEISGNYGKFNQTTFDANRVIMDRFFAAIDVISDPDTGNPICRSDIDPTAPATTPFGIPVGDPGFFTFNPGDGQCRPANVLGGVGAISQEAIDFITTTVVNEFELEQLVFSMIFTGDTGAMFELPGGPVGYAIGFEFREEQSQSTFDPLVRGVVPVTTPDANAGDLLRDLPNPQNSLVFDPESTISNAAGKFTVYDIFGEVRLPILADVPLAELLEVSGAARYSNYSTVGSTFTWTVSGLYAPTEDILFRGTYAQAVRAPNINELFNPAQGTTFRPVDPCDVNELATAVDPALRQANCTAFFNSIGFDPTFGTGTYSYVDPLTARFSGSIAGNPDLQEETATTWTVGAQLTPRFLPGLVVSVDYYNIEIEDAINPVGSQDIVDNCVDSATINNAFCTAFDRRTDNGGFAFLRQVPLNFARQETAGVEFSAQYRFDIADHTFTLAGSGTWVDKLNDFFDPSDITNVDPELGELQRPEWAGRASLTWDWDRLSLTWGTTYFDKMGLRAVEIESVGQGPAFQYTPENGITDETFIHDISFSYDFNDMFDIYGGVNNVFNEKPFVTEQAYPVSPVGTLFFLGVRATM
ncbi:TonB-dependent receptor domain-containing protein [Erythrobacter sp. THAF29]|uniref:TonB-dependent receptor domain-containing protein n=1 Tax=Erythrobacter sp. THAF29 TaxID=2587851 RepID=UPI0012691D24|nr:TonB-dependent receptor [Erythrobacter sp. THAF29]QFT78865.1 Vitamin B12 transporter BtuB precursor [Erythrobacter sp. THAF29]